MSPITLAMRLAASLLLPTVLLAQSPAHWRSSQNISCGDAGELSTTAPAAPALPLRALAYLRTNPGTERANHTPAIFRQQGEVIFSSPSNRFLCVGLNSWVDRSNADDLDFSIRLNNNQAALHQGSAQVGPSVRFGAGHKLSLRRLPDGRIEFLIAEGNSNPRSIAISTQRAAGPMRVEAMLGNTSASLSHCSIHSDDQDLDQLPDPWELQHFGNLSSQPGSDPDQDTRSNLEEYQDGTLPNDRNSYAVPVIWPTQLPPEGYTPQLGPDLRVIRWSQHQWSTTESRLQRGSQAAGYRFLIPAYLDSNNLPEAIRPGQATNQRYIKPLPEDAIVDSSSIMLCSMTGNGSVTWQVEAPQLGNIATDLLSNFIGPVITLGLSTELYTDLRQNNSRTNANLSIQWGFVLGADGSLKIQALNQGNSPITLSGTAGRYQGDSQLRITRNQDQLIFFKDNQPIHQCPSTLSPLTVKVALASITTESTALAIINRCSFDDGDKDRDHLPDFWEHSQLPPDHSHEDLVQLTPESDTDEDGSSTLNEYLNGTDPNNKLSRALPIRWQPNDNITTQPRHRISIYEIRADLGFLTKTNSSQVYDTASLALGLDDEPLLIMQDGNLSFQAQGGSQLTVGLTESNDNSGNNDCEWAIELRANNSFVLFCRHDSPNAIAPPGHLGTYSNSTVLSIRRRNGQISFYRDNQLLHSAKAPSCAPLMIDCSLKTDDSALLCAMIDNGDSDQDDLPDAWEINYFGDISQTRAQDDPDGDRIDNLDECIEGSHPRLPPLAPRDLIWSGNPANHLAIDANNLSKLSNAPIGWVSEASAQHRSANNNLQALEMGNIGRLSLSAALSGQCAIGLASTDIGRNPNELEFALIFNPSPNSNSVTVSEKGRTAYTLKSYSPNNRFAIRRIGRQIEYLKNNQVFYRSKTDAVLPKYRIQACLNQRGAALNNVRASSGDVDEDGMPDDWELTQLTRSTPKLTLNYATLQGFLTTGDPDRDRADNLFEYQHGSDPLQGLDFPRPTSWQNLINCQTTRTDGSSPPGHLRKTTPGNTYNAGANTSNNALTETKGDVSLSFSLNPGPLSIGLSPYENTGIANNSREMPCAFILSATSITLRSPASATALPITGGYDSNTLFGLRRRGNLIEFLKDGISLHSLQDPDGTHLLADCSLANANTPLARSYFNHPDLDDDGIPDRLEWQWLGLNASDSAWRTFGSGDNDLDRDQLSDRLEASIGSNPTSSDSDRDGMSDTWEHQHHLALTNGSNARSDADGDQLNNLAEYRHGTDPHNPDSDNDSLSDGFEVNRGYNPLSADDIRPVYGPGKVRRSGRILSGCAVPVNWLLERRP